VVLKAVNDTVTDSNKLYEKGELYYESDVYDFSYQTYEEFAKTNLGYKKEKKPWDIEDGGDIIQNGFNADYPQIYPECVNLPLYKNWAEEGKVTPVLNQECADCYLFAAMTALEATIAIEFRTKPVLLSRQNTLECIKTVPNINTDGCNCGYSKWIWQIARESKGLVSDEAYGKNYTGKSDGKCDTSPKRSANSEVHHWEVLPANNEEVMRCYVANHGPLVVSFATSAASTRETSGIDFYPNGMREFKRGVFTDPDEQCSGREADHAVVIVGYGTETLRDRQLDYWIIQNSWGNKWGEKGFMRLERNRNLCGVAAEAMFPGELVLKFQVTCLFQSYKFFQF
jgi:cathepsin L